MHALSAWNEAKLGIYLLNLKGIRSYKYVCIRICYNMEQ